MDNSVRLGCSERSPGVAGERRSLSTGCERVENQGSVVLFAGSLVVLKMSDEIDSRLHRVTNISTHMILRAV